MTELLIIGIISAMVLVTIVPVLFAMPKSKNWILNTWRSTQVKIMALRTSSIVNRAVGRSRSNEHAPVLKDDSAPIFRDRQAFMSAQDDLEFSTEISELPTVKLSQYVPLSTKPVQEIPELEVLEPVFFGSAASEDAEFGISTLVYVERSDATTNESIPAIKSESLDIDTSEVVETPQERGENAGIEHDLAIIEQKTTEIYAVEASHDATGKVDSYPEEHVEAFSHIQHFTEDEDQSVESLNSTAPTEKMNIGIDEHESIDYHENESFISPVRGGRGGYDPDADAKVMAAKYRFRQRSAILLAALALVAFMVGFGLLQGMLTATITIIGVVPVLFYLTYLRHTVRLEEQIRQRRYERYVRNNQARAHRRIERNEHYRGLVLVEVDDGDPIFDHLAYHDGITNLGQVTQFNASTHRVAG